MIVEPFAHDRLVDNLNPVGRISYAASTMICTPASLSQEVGPPWAHRRVKCGCASGHGPRIHPISPRRPRRHST